MYISNDDKYHLFLFAAIITILYWIITVLETGKFNSLFLLWSGRFEEEFLKRQQSMRNTIKDDNDNEVTNYIAINFMDNLWENVYYDYKWNGCFGFNKYCHFCRDFCGWICILIVFIMTISTFYILLPSQHEEISGIVSEIEGVSMTATYPICDMQLRDIDDLSVMDLIFLTKTAYYASSKKQIMNQFKIWFGDKYTESWNVSSLSNHTRPTFYHIHNKYDFDIIVVRGTADTSDIMQDLGLWSEIATFQMFSWLIPLTNLFPMNFIQSFIKKASFAEEIIAPSVRDKYDIPVYNYIRDNIMSKGDNYVIILGHSLGGGISQIVGAKLFEYDINGNDNIISFGLSSPGTLYSSKKFGFSAQSLDKTSISVLPRRDIVGMVDDHGGIQQIIECNQQQVHECHSAQTSFCEMYQQCDESIIRNVNFTQCICIGVGKSDWKNCL